MRWSEILRESGDEEGWRRIADLPSPEHRAALAAFAKLADDQRGLPEDLGGAGSGNPDLRIATGIFAWLTEHVGDLTHRMAARHHHRISYGFEYVGQKVFSALRTLRHPYGVGREIEEQVASNHRHQTRTGQIEGSLEEWRGRLTAAAGRYADAHARLIVFNRAQWLAREAAVALGRMNWQRATLYLGDLENHLDSPEAWVDFASLVRVGPNGEPLAYRSP